MFLWKTAEKGQRCKISVKKLYELYEKNDSVYASAAITLNGYSVVNVGDSYVLVNPSRGVCAENDEELTVVFHNPKGMFINFSSLDRDEPVVFALFYQEADICIS